MGNQTITTKNIPSTKMSQDQKDMQGNSHNEQSHHALGDELLKKELWQESVTAYRRAIALNPNFYWSYHNLGIALSKLNLWDEAFRCQEKVAELNPRFWEEQQKDLTVQCHLGDILVKKQSWQEAIEVYSKIIQLNPDFPWSYYHLGFISIQLENWQEALSYLNKSIELNPSLAWGYYYRGETLANLGKWDKAIVDYRQALTLQEDLAIASEKLYYAQTQINQAPAAVVANIEMKTSENKSNKLQNTDNSINRREDSPHNLEFNLELAQVFLQKGYVTDAISTYQQILETAPDNYHVYQLLGDCFARQGKVEEASSCYSHYLEKKLSKTPKA